MKAYTYSTKLTPRLWGRKEWKKEKINNRHVGHQDLVGPKRNRDHHAKSIEDNGKMVEEMQEKMLEIERKITEKKVYTCLLTNLIYICIYCGSH